MVCDESGEDVSLQLKLMSPSEGYTLSVPGQEWVAKFKYSDRELLECVHRVEIPYMISDLLEDCGVRLYTRGCLPLSIIDYRLSPPTNSQLILRPSLLSLLTDLDVLVNSLPNLDHNRRKQLEAKFWKLVYPSDLPKRSPPSCPRLKRLIHKCTHPRLRRRESRDRVSMHNRLPLIRGMGSVFNHTHVDCLALLSSFSKPKCEVGGSWKPMLLAGKCADAVADRRVEAMNNRVVEGEPGLEQVLHRVEQITVQMPNSCTTRIVVSKHKHTGVYYGQLLLDSPPVSSGIFLLGGEAHARLYAVQYLEMVTEAGRKQPKSLLKKTPGKQSTNIVSPRPINSGQPMSTS